MTEQLRDAVAERGDEMRKANPELRRGQAMCNALREINPDVGDFIRGTYADPFNDDGRIGLFNLVLCSVIDGA